MTKQGTPTSGSTGLSPATTRHGTTVTWFAAAKATAADPQRVADAVHHAIVTDTPRLRHLVGVDAEVYVGGRARMSDEEWVALGGPMTDEEFFAEFAARFPAPGSA